MDLEDPVTSFFHITLFEDLVRNLLVLFLPQDPQGSLLPVAIFHPDHPAFHVDSGAWYDLCGSLCSWLWFLALSFLAGLQLHWQNLDCQCHMRLWTQPLCMVFPSEKGFPAHCLSELFDLTCCDPAKISLDKTCEAHDDRKGYLLDLLYIYIIRIYNILLYYLGTVLSCYSACSAHLPSNKCFFPYSVSLSQEPRGALLGTFQNHWYLHRQRHSHIIIYYPYFILPVHGFVSVQAITKYCELHKLGEHRKPVFGNVWKQLLASLAWHSLTILANYLPIFT